MERYDAAVIGSGPGGYVCAIRLGQLGKKTVLIERGDLGVEAIVDECVLDRPRREQGRGDGDRADDQHDRHREPPAHRADHEVPPVSW